jgi:antitoxin component of RelBE/YafQ-DinJ toxin-antitoxin module
MISRIQASDHFNSQVLSTVFGVHEPIDMYKYLKNCSHDAVRMKILVDKLYEKLVREPNANKVSKEAQSTFNDICTKMGLTMSADRKKFVIVVLAKAAQEENFLPYKSSAKTESSMLTMVQNLSDSVMGFVSWVISGVGSTIQDIGDRIAHLRKDKTTHRGQKALDKKVFVDTMLTIMHAPRAHRGQRRGSKEAEKLFQAIQEYNKQPVDQLNSEALCTAWYGLCVKLSIPQVGVDAAEGGRIVQGMIALDRFNPFEVIVANVETMSPPSYEASEASRRSSPPPPPYTQ